jgi:beta-glucanase (GH16 family)
MRVLFFLLVLSTPLALAQRGSEIVWSDEFNGPANTPPDPGKWTYDLGNGVNGWGNDELQDYTDSTENVFLDGEGHLVIRALKNGSRYTSGRIKTKGKFEFQYGRVDARIKIPAGQGIWPAFWMLGANFPETDWPDCGEIDVMENIGKEPSVVHGTIHGPGYPPAGVSARYELAGGAPFSRDFHVFSADWTPGAIRFYVDGRAYATFTQADLPAGGKWVFDHPFFMLLNVAVGGKWPGPPDESTMFPQTMLVDWIRVWQVRRQKENPRPPRHRR